jgi:hypothetical protein
MKNDKEAVQADAKDAASSGKAKDEAPTQDTNSARTGNQPAQEKVWDEEGGSPPGQISSTKTVKPRTESKTGSMGPAKD